MDLLKSRCLTLKLQRASKLLREHMTSKGLDFQVIPAGLHRRNAAERAIQTFKNNFISGHCSTDPSFPLNLSDKLKLHVLLSFNLFRPSRNNPKLSFYAIFPRRFLLQSHTTHATRHQGTSARANTFRSEVLSGVFNSAVFASFWRSSPE